MRVKAAFVAAGAALLAGACAQMQWVKPGADAAALERDSTECRREAWLRSQQFGWWQYPPGPIVVQDRLGRPVLLRPYGAFSDPLFVEGRLEFWCMEDRGWKLGPVEPAPTIQPSQGGAPARSP